MFKYKYEDIDRDIKEHIKNGCFQFCYVPSYYKDLKENLKKDIEQLQELCPETRGELYFIEDIIDHSKSTPEKLAFKDIDLERLRKEYDDSINLTRIAVTCEGIVYPQKDKHLAFFSLTTSTPLNGAMTVYHEYAHILQDQLNYFPKKERTGTKNSFAFPYMQGEVHAEAFANACAFLKNDMDERLEYNLLKKSARTLYSIIKEGHSPLYCDYRVTKEVLDELKKAKKDGEVGKYYNKDGSLNLKNISDMVAKSTKEKGYNAKNFANLIKQNASSKTPAENRLWKEDFEEAKQTLQTNIEPVNKDKLLVFLYTNLKKASNSKEIQSIFNLDYGGLLNEEIKEYRKLYKKTKDKQISLRLKKSRQHLRKSHNKENASPHSLYRTRSHKNTSTSRERT